MENEINTFKELAAIDVSKYVKTKKIPIKNKKTGEVIKILQLSYLSWSWAVKCLREKYPDASWEVKRFGENNLPYQKDESGCYVEVAVTINNITLSQIHPVLDGANISILNPNSFQINTSIQRCLAKAIALHGLGIDIYAGEDLPEENGNIVTPQKTYAKAQDTTSALTNSADIKCSKCGAKMYLSKNKDKNGKTYYYCSNYKKENCNNLYYPSEENNINLDQQLADDEGYYQAMHGKD